MSAPLKAAWASRLILHEAGARTSVKNFRSIRVWMQRWSKQLRTELAWSGVWLQLQGGIKFTFLFLSEWNHGAEYRAGRRCFHANVSAAVWINQDGIDVSLRANVLRLVIYCDECVCVCAWWWWDSLKLASESRGVLSHTHTREQPVLGLTRWKHSLPLLTIPHQPQEVMCRISVAGCFYFIMAYSLGIHL